MKIREGIHWVGTMNPTLRTFDVIMRTEYGTTYNSYLVRDDKTAILDAGHQKLTDLFIEKVRAELDPAEIDYVIVHHTEPDHTGALGKLLDLCPNAEVVSTKIAAKWLGSILHRDFRSRTVEDGEEISLGGKTLRFMTIPFWHWPDTMFTYLKEDKVLFPCDGFGAHFCDERMFDDLVDRGLYEEELRDYYDAIMRPFADKIAEGVKRVKELDIEVICPSHGPVLRADPWAAVRKYEEWSEAHRQVRNKVAVFYASAYGNTRRMAEAVAEGIRRHAEAVVFDATASSEAEMREALESSSGALFGSCTINGDALAPIWGVLDLYALVNRKGKVGGAFGSYGWSGEAVGQIEERLRGLRVKVIESGLKANFVPTEDDLAKCRAFGEHFAQGLAG